MGKDKDQKSTSKTYKDHIKKKIKKKVKKYKKEQSQSYDHKGSRVVEVNKGDAKRYGAMPVARPAQQPNHVFNSNRIMQLQDTYHALTRDSIDAEGKISELTQLTQDAKDKLHTLKTDEAKARNEYRQAQRDLQKAEWELKEDDRKFQREMELKGKEDSHKFAKAQLEQEYLHKQAMQALERESKIEQLKTRQEQEMELLEAQRQHELQKAQIELQIQKEQIANKTEQLQNETFLKAIKHGITNMMPPEPMVADKTVNGLRVKGEWLFKNALGVTLSKTYYDQLDPKRQQDYRQVFKENEMTDIWEKRRKNEKELRELEEQIAAQDIYDKALVDQAITKRQLAELHAKRQVMEVKGEGELRLQKEKEKTAELQGNLAALEAQGAAKDKLHKEHRMQDKYLSTGGTLTRLGPDAQSDERVMKPTRRTPVTAEEIALDHQLDIDSRERAKEITHRNEELTKELAALTQESERLEKEVRAAQTSNQQMKENEAFIEASKQKLQSAQNLRELQSGLAEGLHRLGLPQKQIETELAHAEKLTQETEDKYRDLENRIIMLYNRLDYAAALWDDKEMQQEIKDRFGDNAVVCAKAMLQSGDIPVNRHGHQIAHGPIGMRTMREKTAEMMAKLDATERAATDIDKRIGPLEERVMDIERQQTRVRCNLEIIADNLELGQAEPGTPLHRMIVELEDHAENMVNVSKILAEGTKAMAQLAEEHPMGEVKEQFKVVQEAFENRARNMEQLNNMLKYQEKQVNKVYERRHACFKQVKLEKPPPAEKELPFEPSVTEPTNPVAEVAPPENLYRRNTQQSGTFSQAQREAEEQAAEDFYPYE